MRRQAKLREAATEKGDIVAFSLQDAFLPDAEEIRAALPGTSELVGSVVDFSDSGPAHRAFALVEITHKQTVVVPVERLRPLGRPREVRD